MLTARDIIRRQLDRMTRCGRINRAITLDRAAVLFRAMQMRPLPGDPDVMLDDVVDLEIADTFEEFCAANRWVVYEEVVR